MYISLQHLFSGSKILYINSKSEVTMLEKNITMIGAGKMATILSTYFAKAGHNIFIGARDPDKASQLAKKISNGVQGGPIDAAVQHGTIVFIAIPYLEIQDTLKLTGSLNGKIVVDISNPLKSDFSGLLIGGDTSAAEELEKKLPEAKIVKAFNSSFATVLERGPEYGANRAQVFYAGDDESAKQEVAELIETTGFDSMNVGPLSSARYLEQLTVLVIKADNHLESPVQITPVMLARPSLT
jgi:predicted dinucleotide-binding enzyme